MLITFINLNLNLNLIILNSNSDDFNIFRNINKLIANIHFKKLNSKKLIKKNIYISQ